MARVAVNLRGLPREAVTRGDVLLTPGAWLVSDLLDVRLRGVRSGEPAPDPAGLPAELTLHAGAAAVTARLRPLGADTVRLRLRRPLPLRIGDRALLRDAGSRTVAAGLTVLDVAPPELRRRGRAHAGPRSWTGWTASVGGRGAGPPRVARRTDLLAMGVPPPASTPSAPYRARRAGWSTRAGHGRRLRRWPPRWPPTTPPTRSTPDCPWRRPVARRAFRNRSWWRPCSGTATPGDLALREGRVVRSGERALPAPVRAAMATLRAELERDPFAAPEAARLAELRLGPRQLASLVKAGELMRIAEGVVLLPGADRRALDVLAGLGDEFTPQHGPAGAADQPPGGRPAPRAAARGPDAPPAPPAVATASSEPAGAWSGRLPRRALP